MRLPDPRLLSDTRLVRQTSSDWSKTINNEHTTRSEKRFKRHIRSTGGDRSVAACVSLTSAMDVSSPEASEVAVETRDQSLSLESK